MSKKPGKRTKHGYKAKLRELQVELVKLQRNLIADNGKLLVILEGRDAAGKDGAIKRIVRYLSPRETRVVALGKPSDRERGSWYFQRFAVHLPVPQEFVLFNRSWYNRAGVERVMGFCTEDEYQEFITSVGYFEQMLVDAGIRLFKYYLDITAEEQARRLEARRTDPLKQWKLSPIDQKAQKLWERYSVARNEMLARTHSPVAPWIIVRADDKRQARLNLIRDLLGRQSYRGKDDALLVPDPEIVFEFHQSYIERELIAP